MPRSNGLQQLLLEDPQLLPAYNPVQHLSFSGNVGPARLIKSVSIDSNVINQQRLTLSVYILLLFSLCYIRCSSENTPEMCDCTSTHLAEQSHV